ncbi:hypothetical protein FACS1894199_11500 [Bacteroidia bacterium]|nr:hypothetical protein FACS1894199_11500 [Bacteroidia bacterium]
MNAGTMAELTLKQKREYAKTLYLNENGITQKEIAERAGASVQSVCKWVREGKWEELRTSLLVSKEVELSRLYKQLKNLNDYAESKHTGEQFLSGKEADVLSKITASIRQLETEMNIADKTQVGREFLQYVRRVGGIDESKQVARLFNSYIKQFIK